MVINVVSSRVYSSLRVVVKVLEVIARAAIATVLGAVRTEEEEEEEEEAVERVATKRLLEMAKWMETMKGA